ncbi:hypothetical protein BZL54_04735 [Burkholderia ubonensis subsp. mesacidophila]|uniref:Alginate lyase domain-containing protein n=2 Tax=Burkholderia ubonensis TaxID=101571 RepID=A0A2A4FKA7_9BURK|nr:alginate lyase family protein [Burkholderia ubonensis]PCE33535.1 hypothetical protein BZL54_04735 [Burkholderia ubonensis subsp. mesacidophila]
MLKSRAITRFVSASIVVAMAGCSAAAQKAPAHPRVAAQTAPSGTHQTWPPNEQVARLRAVPAQWAQLRTACENNLDYVPRPVADFAPPPHYGDPKGEARIAGSLAADGNVAYQQGLCYVLSGDVRYARAGERILDAWATGVRQIAPGQGTADFNFSFPRYTLAAAMLHRDSAWDDTAFRTFLLRQVLPRSVSARPNNFGNWGVFLEAGSALYLNDHALMQRAANRWRALMASQVAPDGSLPEETCRSDTTDWCGGPDKGIRGIAYTHYTLLPTTLAAEIFRAAGIDVYAEAGGRTLAEAYARAAAWTLHPETFPYYASNGGRLQGVRTAAYFQVLQHRVPCPDGAEVISQGQLSMDGYELHLLYGT